MLFKNHVVELSEELITGMKLLYLKTIHNFSNQAFNDIESVILKQGFSLYKIKNHLDKLIPIRPKFYDMCLNSCCLFYGEFSQDQECFYCNEPRLSNQTPRKSMPYFSLTERFKIQFACSERVKELMYRWEYVSSKDKFDGILGDIFDGNIYKELCELGLFSDKRELALSISCDGYQIFKQKTDDNWIFLIINNNLSPEKRVKKENLIISFMIPGPSQPKDFNSFLQPLVEELKILKGNFIFQFKFFLLES
jgi:hypothetical protein